MLLTLIFIGTVVSCEPAHGQSAMGSELEYRIKAAFLLNFTKFVTWPDEIEGKGIDPITLCVLGDSPFGSTLDSIKGKKVHGRPIEIVHVPNPSEMPSCHVLFFGKNFDIDDHEIYHRLYRRPILTVGEKKGFADRGGMINFIVVENKVRFEINPHAVETAFLKISSQLLKLAVIVEIDEYMEN